MLTQLADAWGRQIAHCDANGSPFTARVLEAAWADGLRGGALRDLLAGWPGDPWTDALPLRVAGALHGLALDGSDAALAALYPPAVAVFDARRGPAVVRAALRTHRERIAQALQSAPQTNEVGRSAVLLGGFARVAQATGLPLATLEIGASAGLNQLWPRYRYTLGSTAWGDAASPVKIHCDWRGQVPSLPAAINVAAHAGCDVAPVDLATPAAATRLASYVWADQRERLARLFAAIAVAQRTGVHIERCDAGDWVERELARARPGVATVLYHSIVWQYLPEATRQRLRALINAAGQRATLAAPLAWLAFEPPDADSQPQLALTLWPGGERRVLAEAQAHGQHATWHAP